MSLRLSRRRLIGALGAGAGTVMLSGCDRITASPTVQRVLGVGQGLTMRAQTDRHRPHRARARVRRCRLCRRCSAPTATKCRRAKRIRRTSPAASPTGGSLSTERSAVRSRCRSTRSGECRRAPRSPGTTASRAGAQSASGPACRSSCCSTRGRGPERALYRLPLRRRFRRNALLREHRSDRRLSPADDSRLGDERPAARRRPRCAAAAPGRTPARLQAGQVCDARRGGRTACRNPATAKAATGRTRPIISGTPES